MLSYLIPNFGTEISCVGGSNEEKCNEACTSSYPGTVGICQNDSCFCSNDPKDLKCSGDGSFGNCPKLPFCRKQCCKKGYPGGECWFGLQCRCTGEKSSDPEQ